MLSSHVWAAEEDNLDDPDTPLQTSQHPLAQLHDEDSLLCGKRGKRPDSIKGAQESAQPTKKHKALEQSLSEDQIQKMAKVAVNENYFCENVIDCANPKIVWLRDTNFYDAEHDVYVNPSDEDKEKIKSLAIEIFYKPRLKVEQYLPEESMVQEIQKRFTIQKHLDDQDRRKKEFYSNFHDERLSEQYQEIIRGVKHFIQGIGFNDVDIALDILNHAYDIGLMSTNNKGLNKGWQKKYGFLVRYTNKNASQLGGIAAKLRPYIDDERRKLANKVAALPAVIPPVLPTPSTSGAIDGLVQRGRQ